MWCFSLVGGPTWAPHTLVIAWSARRRLGGKGKGIRQKLPLLSKTRDLLITKRGKIGSKFKFKLVELQRGKIGLERKHLKRGKRGEDTLQLGGHLIFFLPFPKYPFHPITHTYPSWPYTHIFT